QAGVYGGKGVPAPSNMPGSRHSATTWRDASGTLWLFGGVGYDAHGMLGYLNDLWKYDGANWTWMAGDNTANAPAHYGTKGSGVPANTPGARGGAAGATVLGQLALFAGYGYDCNG